LIKRLRSFLLAESSKQHLLRETYTLAGNLVDLYFAKGGHIEIVAFQNLVIACLILACKIKEGRMPTISFDIFSRDELLNLEKRVAKRLTYKLTPVTYHGVAERLIYLWDCFTLQKKLPYPALAGQQEGVNLRVRGFYEELDCAFMGKNSSS